VCSFATNLPTAYRVVHVASTAFWPANAWLHLSRVGTLQAAVSQNNNPFYKAVAAITARKFAAENKEAGSCVERSVLALV
jgi:hypothetical protein